MNFYPDESSPPIAAAPVLPDGVRFTWIQRSFIIVIKILCV